MRLYDFAGDGEAKTAAAVARAGFVDLIEALEHALRLLRRNVRAGVVDSKQGRPWQTRLTGATRRAARLAADGDSDLAGRRRVLEGVLDQVVEHLPDAMRIAHDPDRLGRSHVEGDAALLRAEQEARPGSLRKLGYVDRLPLPREIAGLDAAQIQQVFNRPSHTLGFLAAGPSSF